MGGDDWALPSIIGILEYFEDQIVVGDISNMNGGRFAPHASHDDGTHVDAWSTGYDARDAATAARMIDLLNDDTYGSSIGTVFVTRADAIWNAIDGVRLDDGRLATDVIRHATAHTTHFHWVLDA
ncbi:penicillin-insensitive murein endopeptidase [Microvirga massiliensis]|uniref:penicillin-insensitive murein endopeptidase n=1 Tax=Microvirga massiliensis TaxID=1033741 RepID=UPI00062BAB41|nr:penicillin-insensitive murein endopeptidase [Microvirga massiliensis]